ATDAEGAKVNTEVLSYGNVKSVAYSTNGLRLDLGLDGQTSMLEAGAYNVSVRPPTRKARR
ncbi:hypothetical protein CTI14_66675, partial [Methylobacterium radiotolerans]